MENKYKDHPYLDENGYFKKGNPGGGYPKGTPRCMFKELINAIKTDHNKIELVEQLWDMAINGEPKYKLKAIDILIKTLDGDPKQQIEISGSLSYDEKLKILKEEIEKKLNKDK
jgi:hypothetical protein